MQRYVDCMIIIPNEKLLANTTSRTSSRAAFAMVDEVLLQAVRGISDVITTSGEQNIDFNDIYRIMHKSEKALIGIGEASGPGRHLEALKEAISSPLLENADIGGSKGFIVHFLAADPGLQENMEVLECIRKYASADSIIKFGCSYDPTMQERYRVTLIAAGFDSQKASRFMNRARPLETLTPVGKLTPEDRFADFRPKNNLDVPACLRRKKRV
jgi:cell division protein FtsZ